MSFPGTGTAKNQAELVEQYVAKYDGDPIFEEELEAIGIAKMHERDATDMAEYLETLLKSRRVITRVKWKLLSPDQDEHTEFATRSVRWRGIENLVGQSRQEIATALINVFAQDTKVVGVEWGIGADHITASVSETGRDKGMEGRFWVTHDTSR